MTNPTAPGAITCRAAVVWKSGEPLRVEEIQVDPPKSSEIRIKMLCASMCHTDILCCNGLPVSLFPRIPGHEGVGMVESVGDSVTHLKPGDIVMPLYLGECGECPNCNSGRTNLCHKYPLGMNGLMADGTSRMSVGGAKIYNHMSCSTWSEYAVLEANYAVKVDPRMSLPHASFLCCGFTTGFGSTWKVANLRKGSTVAVIGLGSVGLGVSDCVEFSCPHFKPNIRLGSLASNERDLIMWGLIGLMVTSNDRIKAVKGAEMQGASKIIGVDINDFKHEKAKAFGMTDFINPKNSGKSVSELLKEATGGLGVDYCFECSGVPALLNEAIEGSKVGLGTIVFIGAGLQNSGELNYIPLLFGRSVLGSIYGGVRPQTDLPKIIEKCVNKEIDLDQLGTHEVSLSEINKAFEHMKEPNCVKVVIKF